MPLTHLIAFCAGVVVGAVGAVGVVVTGLRRQAPQVPPSPPVPQVPQAPKTLAEVMDDVVKTAPDRFAGARRAEAPRRAIACVVCGEPTAIACDKCGSRLCVGHEGAPHPCAAA